MEIEDSLRSAANVRYDGRSVEDGISPSSDALELAWDGKRSSGVAAVGSAE